MKSIWSYLIDHRNYVLQLETGVRAKCFKRAVFIWHIIDLESKAVCFNSKSRIPNALDTIFGCCFCFALFWSFSLLLLLLLNIDRTTKWMHSQNIWTVSSFWGQTDFFACSPLTKYFIKYAYRHTFDFNNEKLIWSDQIFNQMFR